MQNLGGGLVGNVGPVTGATNAGYVGSSTDSGHPASDNPNFAVIQGTHELNKGRLACSARHDRDDDDDDGADDDD